MYVIQTSIFSLTLENLIYACLFFLIGFFVYILLDKKNRKKNIIVKKQAYTDQLTRRGNRYLFLSILDKLIIKNKKFAVCFMDLDGFKQINDSMGHDAGDELLVKLANAFDEKLPKNATAYRLGGDEFAIVIEGIKTTADITKILDQLKEHLKTPFVIAGNNISLEYSLGIAIYPEDAANRQDLIMYADDAMYYIKEHGKNDYYFHNNALKAKLENKNKMEKDLKAACEQNQFGIDFQPRIDSKDTSKICFESLLYWNHPVLGKIASSYFIKQADDMALTIKLDQYVLQMACEKLNYFKANGHENVQMAVNISNRHASKKDFVDKLCDILNDHAINPGEIQIEITDNIAIKQIESYKLMFEKLKQCGASIIISNIEIKYEAIKLFSELHIDEIKLSAAYLANDSELNPNLLDDVIQLCKDLNYQVIITSIEDEKTLNYAIRKGADKLQGNILFKKMEETLVDDFIKEYSKYTNRIDNIITGAKTINHPKT